MLPRMPFDPVRRAEEVESKVMRNDRRLYHRFRPAPYYGGIATADAVGCSFLCAYCWSYSRNLHPERFNEFFTPRDVASRLITLARNRGFHRFRISGAEPLLGPGSFEHVLEVIRLIHMDRPNDDFVLETNGLFLGSSPEVIRRLPVRHLQVRVSLKGIDETSFEKLSGAEGRFFIYPLIALRELRRKGIQAWPALLVDLFKPESLPHLDRQLRDYSDTPLEKESLEAYDFVLRNISSRLGVKLSPSGGREGRRPQGENRRPERRMRQTGRSRSSEGRPPGNSPRSGSRPRSGQARRPGSSRPPSRDGKPRLPK